MSLLLLELEGLEAEGTAVRGDGTDEGVGEVVGQVDADLEGDVDAGLGVGDEVLENGVVKLLDVRD